MVSNHSPPSNVSSYLKCISTLIHILAVMSFFLDILHEEHHVLFFHFIFGFSVGIFSIKCLQLSPFLFLFLLFPPFSLNTFCFNYLRSFLKFLKLLSHLINSYFAALEEEEKDDDFQGVIPVGRGLSTMTRPTT